MSFFNRFIVWVLRFFPKSFIWLFSRRYVAGKSLDDAVEKTKALNGLGLCVTMDVLGEDIETLDEAGAEKEECLRVLDAQKAHSLDGNLSLKLTALGLRINKEKCYENVREIVQKAGDLNNFVRIDMEDSSTTDDTLEIYRRLRKEYDNVGTVIQAYLKRSKEDVQQLIDEGVAHLRICKGIYIEPADIAYKGKQRIRDAFMELVEMMLASGSFAGIATHDRELIDRSLEFIQTKGIGKDGYEFQMLLGVTERLRGEVVSAGHRMRVYVPYGEHWYGYSMRRLKENPSVAGHIIKNLFIQG